MQGGKERGRDCEREREREKERERERERKGVRAHRIQLTSSRTKLITSGISAGGARGRSS